MNFQKDVIEQSKTKTVIVDMFAEWCGPCKMIKPFLKKAVEGREDVDLVMIDIDQHPQLSKQFNVRSVPHIMVFKKGVQVAKYQGGSVPHWVEQMAPRTSPS